MKRDPRLHRLSSDHHHALVLARRVKQAAQQGGDEVERAWAEVIERFEAELAPHFDIEERCLLPALRTAGEALLVDRTLADHAAIRACVSGSGDRREHLAWFAELLEAHVRFEERELFETAQALLDREVLDAIAQA